MAKEPKKKVVTKKDQSRLRREQRQNRWIILGTIIVMSLVFSVIIFGLLYELVFQGMQAVVSVNGEKISVNQLKEEVTYQRFSSVQTYLSYYQIYNSLGPDMGSSFLSGLQSIQSQLSDANSIVFGQDVLDQMIDNRLIAQYAAENGISVTQAEIDEALQEAFRYFPEGTPTPAPTSTPFSTSTMNPTQYALVSPTPEVSPTALIETTEEVAADQPTPEVSVTSETVEATTEPTSIPENTVEPTITLTPTPIPTATQYTFESFETDLDNYISRLEEIGLDRKMLEKKFEESLLREKVYEKITASVFAEEEQVWARHILVDSEETANEVLQRLNAGEDWTTLAAEYSTDTSNKDRGGDLGWFSKGTMVAPFEESAYNLSIGEISDPVQTDFGWHIIQVLGHEIRSVSASRLDQIKQERFSEWLTEQSDAADIVTRDNWQDDVPTSPTIPAEFLIES